MRTASSLFVPVSFRSWHAANKQTVMSHTTPQSKCPIAIYRADAGAKFVAVFAPACHEGQKPLFASFVSSQEKNATVCRLIPFSENLALTQCDSLPSLHFPAAAAASPLSMPTEGGGGTYTCTRVPEKPVFVSPQTDAPQPDQ